MGISNSECASIIIKASSPVIKINDFINNQWYRKPKDSRRGPWLQSDYEILNDQLWRMENPCLYFLTNKDGELKYVGISVNRIKDRWRTSPAYDINGKSLNRNEIFHSQCWSHMCNVKKSGINDNYLVSVIHATELVNILEQIDHQISGLSVLKDDPDIAVIAIEVWFIKRFNNQLWNKRK